MNLELPKCDSNMNMCDGISNFEPGMMLGQNSWVFIVISTVTPSVKMAGVAKKSSAKVDLIKSYCQKILKILLF